MASLDCQVELRIQEPQQLSSNSRGTNNNQSHRILAAGLSVRASAILFAPVSGPRSLRRRPPTSAATAALSDSQLRQTNIAAAARSGGGSAVCRSQIEFVTACFSPSL